MSLKSTVVTLGCSVLLAHASAQDTLARSAKDALPEVIVQGFASGLSLAETPYAIGYLTRSDLERAQGISLLPAVNTIPGVRMEERSPQSYRLSIRGSLLRSPFGVRNVKIYWDDMPLTDASGNTYVNVLDPNAFQSLEILKGPGGSMYGANTGGVVLFHGDTVTGSRVQLRGGSYNMWGEDAQWQYHDGKLFSSLFQSHNQSDGYRENSAFHKDTYQGWGHYRFSEKEQLDWLGLYTNLYYQTPGGLTLQQMIENPRADRPSTPTIPGASEQKASVYAQTFFAGLTNRYTFNDHWSNATTALVSGTHFDNPFLTDYEQRKELTLDALTCFIYDSRGTDMKWRLVFGAEYQYTRAYIHDWGNSGGVPDTTQSDNRLQAYQFLPYAQGELTLSGRWLFQAGFSVNTLHYHYLPLYGPNTAEGVQYISFDPQLLPRLSIQYRIMPSRLSIYATLSRGYSPPTIAEIFPGTALLYNDLQPEEGWNIEAGLKSYWWENRLQLTLSAYDFRLQNTIVPRYDSAGHAYYVNAGSTNQKGLEAQGTGWILSRPKDWLSSVRLFVSYSLQDYHFTNYKEGASNYSGNQLTGVPRNIVVIGADLNTRPGLYVNATYTYTDRLPLNDANTAWAGSYLLLQGKVGWDWTTRSHPGKGGTRFDLFFGADNILNQLYSLGNDLNAAAGRYYNPAPATNVFAGGSVRF